MKETIAKLVQYEPTFSATESGSVIHDYFLRNIEGEGVVLVDEEKPVGILMRNDFYQKIGKQFGYALYMKRNISLIMKTDIVFVDLSCDMASFGYIAMNRNKNSLYDFIIVMDNDHYAGIVSISEFLMEMSRTKEREIELLSKQQQILMQANEAEKQHRMEMEHKNTTIKNLLDNAGQGFLSFGSDLSISAEYSRECDEIFGFTICNKNFLEILKDNVNDDILQMMQNTFENIFAQQDKKRNKIYISILPHEIKIRGSYIKIEYKVIHNEFEKSVMIILTDITEKKDLELKNADEKNNVKLIIKAINSKAEINQAVCDLDDFFKNGVYVLLNSGEDKKTILFSIFRIIHTMKGDFSLNSLHHTSAMLHELEDTLSDMMENIETIRHNDILEFVNGIDCETLIKRDIKIIKDALGNEYFEKDVSFTVSKERLNQIDKDIRENFKDHEQIAMLQLLDKLLYPNIKDIIRNYDDYTKAVAVKMDKRIEDFIISGHDVYINNKTYLPFTKSLVHIFRNIVDHGIETPDERIASGKQEQGTIICHIEKFEDKFVLNISDDGKGIDTDALKRKAIAKDIFTENELNTLSSQQILDIIFFDNLSTRDNVSMLSGRGVGLAAVRAEVSKIGGTISVDTDRGKSTNFSIVMPIHQEYLPMIG